MTDHQVFFELSGVEKEVEVNSPVLEEVVVMSPERQKLAADQSRKLTETPVESVVADEGPRRRGRKLTTGRNTPFTVKLRRETNDLIYTLADEMECNALAEVIEKALEALQKQRAGGR
ncbi:MAG: hypothetical protein LBG44_02620 [Gemmatimonadota bacterium]|nr:hypothetical protein [Gemmatimonadota bacterium]